MSDVDTLRAAATKLRELAGDATPGPWKADPDAFTLTVPQLNGCCAGDGWLDNGQDAEFIATMNPDLALLLADWLDKEAEGIESGNWRPTVEHALAVARKVLS